MFLVAFAVGIPALLIASGLGFSGPDARDQHLQGPSAGKRRT